MTLKSIEKLRGTVTTFAAQCDVGWMLNGLDQIESEIAERYMELPVDMDGVPIHVGDEIEFATKERFTTEGVDAHGTFVWRNDEFDHIQGDSCRHIKPRTVEDVLVDMLETAVGYSDAHTTVALGAVKGCADELRDLLGGDGR